MTINARVQAGRPVVDEPATLPEGTEVALLSLDPGDWLDEGDRGALHAALQASERAARGRHGGSSPTACALTERRVRFTATARDHVAREQQWWLENRGYEGLLFAPAR